MDYNVLKGTHDVIKEEALNYSFIEDKLSGLADLYNFEQFRVPVIEKSNLFIRSVGESSDVVRKEMYTFLDKGNREITLRPEFTAGIIRSIVNNKLLNQDQLVKAYYVGPVFRYERPQLGRYRQFNQFGIEIVGSSSYLRDVEAISFGYVALKILGFEDITIKINTLGDEKSRNDYKNALKDFFSNKIDEMCEDCKERLKLNPLRILDCKVKEDQEIIKNAPSISDYLSDESKERFQNVLNMLDILEIPYSVDESLVRGLDYYSETVFEFHYVSKKGMNYGAIGAGGFYNNLVKEMGGPDVPGVGLSFGIERLYNILKDDEKIDEKPGIDVYLIPLGNADKQYIFTLLSILRDYGFSSEINLESTSISSSFKKAEKLKATYAIIIGEDEIKNHKYQVKNVKTQEQIELQEDELIEFLDKNIFDDLDECDDENCSCHHHHEE